MKKILTLSLLLLTLCTQAQLSYSRKIHVNEGTAYPDPDFTSIRLLHSEHAFLLGADFFMDTPHGYYLSSLTKADYILNHEWTKKINAFQPGNTLVSLNAHVAGKLSNNKYFLLGTARDTLLHGPDSSGIDHPEYPAHYFVVCDSVGNLIWAKYYRDTVNSQAFSYEPRVIVSHDTVDILIPEYDHQVWFRINNNGDLLQHARFYAPGSNSWGTLQTDAQHNVLIVSGTGAEIRAVKLNAAGSIVWSKRYMMPSGAVYSGHMQNDGSFFLGGTYGPAYWLMKFDPIGNFLWGKSYHNAVQPQLNYFVKEILEDASGDLYLLSDTMQLKVNASGELLTAQHITYDIVPAFDITKDTVGVSFAINGSGDNVVMLFDQAFANTCMQPTSNFHIQDSVFSVSTVAYSPVNISHFYESDFPVTLDTMNLQFNSVPYCPAQGGSFLGIEEKQNDQETIWVYPNPASDKINIQVQENTMGYVADIHGRVCLKQMLTTGKNSLDISRLPNGMYVFYSAQGSGRFVVNR